MPENLGYVVFSLFSQAATGMVLYMFFAYSRIESSTRRLQGKIALAMLGVSGLVFIWHATGWTMAADSGNAPRSAWIYRQIFCLLLVGTLLAAWVIFRSRLLMALSAIAGLILIFIMTKASLPTAGGLQKGYAALSVSAADVLLLGPLSLFFISCLKNRNDAAGVSRQILSWQPMAVCLAFVLRMLVTVIQSLTLENPSSLTVKLVSTHAAILLLGAGPLLLLVIRSPLTPVRDETGMFAYNCLLGKVSIMVGFIWAGEFTGRLAL